MLDRVIYAAAYVLLTGAPTTSVDMPKPVSPAPISMSTAAPPSASPRMIPASYKLATDCRRGHHRHRHHHHRHRR